MLALSLLHQVDGTDQCTETWLLEAFLPVAYTREVYSRNVQSFVSPPV
jgi:hypothetical protein